MQMLTQPVTGTSAAGVPAVAGDAAWLSANALEPNFTLMPQWALPLAEICGKSRDLHAVQVMANDGRPGALAVFERRKWRWGLPWSHVESWFGGFPISGTPLLSASDPVGAGARLIERTFTQTGVVAMIMSHVTGHHAVSSVLVDACAEVGAPVRFLDDRQRAALRCNGDHNAWFEAGFPRKRRKEFRRLSARLAETGKLRTDLRQCGDEGLDVWIDEFLVLEAAGWKGRRGTALLSSESSRTFIRDSFARLDAAGKLLCWRMSVDDRPVAMMFGVRERSTCWIVKIAHDPELARFSPGVLLVLEVTRMLFEDDSIIFADSCAEAGHPMIDHIWKDRLAVRDVMIGRPGQSGLQFASLFMLEKVRRRARAALKSLRSSLRKGKL